MKIVKAELIKLSTGDGLVNMMDHIQLGKTYLVDTDSIRVEYGYNKEHKVGWRREVISVSDKGGGWLPTEMLKIEGRE